jgi:predicted dehydrogenase
MSRLRIGVIGAGRIVERAHLPLLRAMDEVRLAGLFDPDQQRARALGAQFGVERVCDNLEQLLDLGLDAALVACPNYLHASMSIAALEAGLHVLCEKPMAISLNEAEAMVAAAERSGRELMVGFVNRFRPEVAALHQTIQAGQLGPISAIRCGWLRRSGVPGSGSWFTSRAQAGGGVLNDLGSHLIDLALWLGGRHEIRSASCALHSARTSEGEASWYQPPSAATHASDVETSAHGFVVLDGPLDLFVEASWDCATPADQTYIQLRGAHGSARLETVFGFSPSGERPEYPLRIWQGDEAAPRLARGSSDLLQPYRDELQFFVESVRVGRSLRPWLRDSLATVRVIDALYRAAEPLPTVSAGEAHE